MVRFGLSAVAIATSLVLSDCAAPLHSPESERPPAQIPATIAPEQSAAPTPVPQLPAPAPAPAPTPTPTPTPTTPATPSATKASPGPTSGRAVSKPSDTVGRAAPKPTPATEPAPKAAVPAPQAQTLDLGSLEQRLKDTKAIGVFTKLSLKNQVDDLLGELRAFHNGSAKTPTAELRQKYDTLIIKVLTLLQDGDPQLASAISSSREALWGILMDPKQFAQI